jgi:hypothetical protein
MYYSIISSGRGRHIRQTGIEEQIMPDKPENSAFKLLSSRKTLVMATAEKNGAPNVSYAPFVHRAPPLYVYTSSLSRHTRNMMETGKASVMFIEDGTGSRTMLMPDVAAALAYAEYTIRKEERLERAGPDEVRNGSIRANGLSLPFFSGC